ncbi:MAG TPA: AMP-binding protein, partial [Acidimicrobiales bacterium]|nr:AMP-binding protein [Acidimicrobiales bacterium]
MDGAMNLAALVTAHAEDARALHDGERWATWGEVRRRAAGVTVALREAGVGADDRVAVAWPTSVEFVAAYLGILAAGAVAVPLNPNSPAAELERELEAVTPALALVGGNARQAMAGSARTVYSEFPPPADHYEVAERRDDDI